MLGSFNGPEPGGPELTESERRKEACIPLGYTASLRSPGNQPEIERHGDPSSDGTRMLYCILRVYIPVASLDKDQETRLYKFTKEARSNRGRRAKRRSISKEGHK